MDTVSFLLIFPREREKKNFFDNFTLNYLCLAHVESERSPHVELPDSDFAVLDELWGQTMGPHNQPDHLQWLRPGACSCITPQYLKSTCILLMILFYSIIQNLVYFLLFCKSTALPCGFYCFFPLSYYPWQTCVALYWRHFSQWDSKMEWCWAQGPHRSKQKKELDLSFSQMCD